MKFSAACLAALVASASAFAPAPSAPVSDDRTRDENENFDDTTPLRSACNAAVSARIALQD